MEIKDLYLREKRIENYVERLTKATSSYMLINEVLSDTKGLKTYLLGMGLPEKVWEKAGVQELIKDKLATILKSEKCEVFEDKIVYSSEHDYNRVGPVDVFGVNYRSEFCLSNQERLIPTDNDEVDYLYVSQALTRTLRFDKYGAVASRESHGNGPYAGDYDAAYRQMIDGQLYIRTESTDGASYDDQDTRIDTGNPLEIDFADTKENANKLIVANYRKYVQLHHELKEWFMEKFPELQEEFEKVEFVDVKAEPITEDAEIVEDMEEYLREKQSKISANASSYIDQNESLRSKIDVMDGEYQKIGDKSIFSYYSRNLKFKLAMVDSELEEYTPTVEPEEDLVESFDKVKVTSRKEEAINREYVSIVQDLGDEIKRKQKEEIESLPVLVKKKSLGKRIKEFFMGSPEEEER